MWFQRGWGRWTGTDEDEQQDARPCDPVLPACLRANQEPELAGTCTGETGGPQPQPPRRRPRPGAAIRGWLPKAVWRAPAHGICSVSDNFTKSQEGGPNLQPRTVSMCPEQCPCPSPARRAWTDTAGPRLAGLLSGQPHCPAAFASAPSRSPALWGSMTGCPVPDPLPTPATTAPLGDPAGTRRQQPHHVELVQAQPVDARPLTVHRLPEGLKEQVLWEGKASRVTEGRGSCSAKGGGCTRQPGQDTTGGQPLRCSATRRCHESGLETRQGGPRREKQNSPTTLNGGHVLQRTGAERQQSQQQGRRLQGHLSPRPSASAWLGLKAPPDTQDSPGYWPSRSSTKPC